jgi:hypothetical protein
VGVSASAHFFKSARTLSLYGCKGGGSLSGGRAGSRVGCGADGELLAQAVKLRASTSSSALAGLVAHGSALDGFISYLLQSGGFGSGGLDGAGRFAQVVGGHAVAGGFGQLEATPAT